MTSDVYAQMRVRALNNRANIHVILQMMHILKYTCKYINYDLLFIRADASPCAK